MQQLVTTVEQRDGFLLHLEETEIEDVSNLNLDWLIDMKELEVKEKDYRSVVIDDTSIVSFRHKPWFFAN